MSLSFYLFEHFRASKNLRTHGGMQQDVAQLMRGVETPPRRRSFVRSYYYKRSLFILGDLRQSVQRVGSELVTCNDRALVLQQQNHIGDRPFSHTPVSASIVGSLLDIVIREKHGVTGQVELRERGLGECNEICHVFRDVLQPLESPGCPIAGGLRGCTHGSIVDRLLGTLSFSEQKECWRQVSCRSDAANNFWARRPAAILVLVNRLSRNVG